jgi:outer membrane murein-binding lipoprotein Lpp
MRSRCVLTSFLVASVLVGQLVGCASKPDAANIELRKKIQQLETDVAKLQKERTADLATMQQLRQSKGGKIDSTLSQERLDALVTVHSIRVVDKATAQEDLDVALPGIEGFAVLFAPVDRDNDEFKSAGEATVQIFDLRQKDNLIGEWKLSWFELNKTWVSGFFLEGYLIKRPWMKTPTPGELTVRVTFIESLTGRVFESTQKIVVK